MGSVSAKATLCLANPCYHQGSPWYFPQSLGNVNLKDEITVWLETLTLPKTAERPDSSPEAQDCSLESHVISPALFPCLTSGGWKSHPECFAQ